MSKKTLVDTDTKPEAGGELQYLDYEFIDANSAEENETSSDATIQPTLNYICGRCDFAFATRLDLNGHLKEKHLKIYQLITQYRKDKASELEHIATDEKDTYEVDYEKSTEEYSFFICKCKLYFSRFQDLRAHVVDMHSEEFDDCADETLSKVEQVPDTDLYESEPHSPNTGMEENQLQSPMPEDDTFSDNEKSETPPPVYATVEMLVKNETKSFSLSRGLLQCKLCQKKFYLKKLYLAHLVECHADQSIFRCDKCGKEFFDETSLKDHHKLHGEKTFSCETCGKSFMTKSKLKIHSDTHFRRKTIKCDYCFKTFAAQSGYKVHLKKHLGLWEKNLQCSVCGSKFRYQYNLNMHMKSHTKEKSYFCDICAKGFTLERQLKVHMDGHNNVRNYKCEYCKQAFVRRQTWRRHLVTHTGEKSYQCSLCSVAYCDRRTLRKHLEKSHPNSGLSAYTKPKYAVPVVVEK